MTESLPTFRYHPDPLGTGSVVASPTACRRCGQRRGYVYVGPVHAEAEFDDALCPWCIADGSAAEAFDVEFVDADGVGDYGAWEPVAPEIVDEVSRRTPGFTGWQQERWWTHCADAAEFLGRAGRRELEERWQGAVPALMVEAGLDEASWREYAAALDAEGSPTAYVFRCRHCGRLGGYSDCH